MGASAKRRGPPPAASCQPFIFKEMVRELGWPPGSWWPGGGDWFVADPNLTTSS